MRPPTGTFGDGLGAVDNGRILNPVCSESAAASAAYNLGMRQVVGTLQVEPQDATFGAVVRDVVLRGASDATIAELTEL